MQQKQLLKTNFLTQEEWNLTPIRVKDLVVQQKLRIEEQSIKIEELEKQLQQLKEKQENLQEKVNCNSQNSSIPPSTELIKPEKKKPPKRKKRFRGGQLGHVGYSRPLYDESECTSIENHLPQTCKCCGEELSGLDENPYRHQVIKIPPIKPKIEEHRLHQLECHHCGEKTRAKLPEAISKSGYDPTVVALVAVMSGVYRHSHRMIVSAMDDFFGIRMALGFGNGE